MDQGASWTSPCSRGGQGGVTGRSSCQVKGRFTPHFLRYFSPFFFFPPTTRFRFPAVCRSFSWAVFWKQRARPLRWSRRCSASLLCWMSNTPPRVRKRRSDTASGEEGLHFYCKKKKRCFWQNGINCDHRHAKPGPCDCCRIHKGLWWLHQDLHSAVGLRFQWEGSRSSRTLLRCLGVDAKTIVSGAIKKFVFQRKGVRVSEFLTQTSGDSGLGGGWAQPETNSFLLLLFSLTVSFLLVSAC